MSDNPGITPAELAEWRRLWSLSVPANLLPGRIEDRREMVLEAFPRLLDAAEAHGRLVARVREKVAEWRKLEKFRLQDGYLEQAKVARIVAAELERILEDRP